MNGALGVKKPMKFICKISKVPAFNPRPKVQYRSYDEYKELLLAMNPFQFMEHYSSVKSNLANGTIAPQMVSAFEFVAPIQSKQLQIAIKEREIERAAAAEAPPVLTEEEKLVKNGTHAWACETEKCGGKGQTRQVWTLKRVE